MRVETIGDATLYVGDSRDVLKTLAEASVDSVVCDPPYELGFMGKGWDSTGVANDPALWREVLRVLKPGGHLLAFSGTRTYHRMVCAIEDAGFEIRDQIGWLYGSGFPKSHNGEWGGTALKPAWEPICMARKPLAGTVEANWRVHGTGALNIDGCRVEAPDGVPLFDSRSESRSVALGDGLNGSNRTGEVGTGRWPANVIHDGSDEAVALFPAETGKSDGRNSGRAVDSGWGYEGAGAAVGFGDSGSAARFFYCAKADREDRNEGVSAGSTPAVSTGATKRERERADWPVRNGNHHPTVKPTDLMRYLCRLVTPAGGLVLDPFMGSGSTGKAAMLEGLRFVGIDLTPEYVEIARARIEFAKKQGFQPDLLEAA